MNRVVKEWREDRKDNELLMLTLYARPIDYPDRYVIRAWFVGIGDLRPSGGRMLFDEHADALLWIQSHFPELFPMPREPHDDPKIVGTWL